MKRVSVADLAARDQFSFRKIQPGPATLADHGRIVGASRAAGDAVTDGSRLRLYDVDARRAIGVLDEPTLNINEVVIPSDGPRVLAVVTAVVLVIRPSERRA